jgi:O-antigen/teichoic acid export membrane protein
VAWHGALAVWLRFAVALALFRLAGATGAVALWGYTIASGLVLLSQFSFYAVHLRRVRPAATADVPQSVTAEWRRRIDSFSWPFSVFGIVNWSQVSSERWSLQAFATTAVVGEYAALSQLGLGLPALLGNVMLQLGLPIFYQRAGDASDPAAVRAAHRLNFLFLGVTGLATLCLVAIAAAFHGEIFDLIVAGTFRPVSSLLPLMMLSGSLLACAQVATGFLLTNADSQRLILPKTLSSLAGAFGMIVGAQQAGIVGVVWASIFASALHLMLVLFTSRIGRDHRGGSLVNSPVPITD